MRAFPIEPIEPLDSHSLRMEVPELPSAVPPRDEAPTGSAPMGPAPIAPVKYDAEDVAGAVEAKAPSIDCTSAAVVVSLPPSLSSALLASDNSAGLIWATWNSTGFASFSELSCDLVGACSSTQTSFILAPGERHRESIGRARTFASMLFAMSARAIALLTLDCR